MHFNLVDNAVYERLRFQMDGNIICEQPSMISTIYPAACYASCIALPKTYDDLSIHATQTE